MKVRYRRQAQLDIDNIHEYIEKRNPRAATEVVAGIRYAADRLDRGRTPDVSAAHRGPTNGWWQVFPTLSFTKSMKQPTKLRSLPSSTVRRIESVIENDTAIRPGLAERNNVRSACRCQLNAL